MILAANNDRVRESTATVGAGDLALLGAVVGFRAFGAVLNDQDVRPYTIEGLNSGGGPSGEWETGLGTYNAGLNTLSRTTVLASSNAGAAVVFSAGAKQVWIDAPAAFLSGLLQAGNNLADVANVATARHSLGLDAVDAPTFAGLTLGATPLVQDAADILALRRGVNPQGWRVYNGFTDASNNEHLFLGFIANNALLRVINNGTGTLRSLFLDGAAVNMQVNGVTQWQVNGSGVLQPSASNAKDVGSATNLPRSIYWGTQALGPDGTVNNPTFAFASEVALGLYRVSANALGIGIGGTLRYQFSTSGAGFLIHSSHPMGWGSSGISLPDVFLWRGASAGTLEQRNGANAQTFRVYGTFTDASNYERMSMGFGGGTFLIGSEQAGTGQSRSVTFLVGGSQVWQFNTSGHFVPVTSNARDIGSATNLVRNIYASGGVATKVKAGALADADFVSPSDGMLAIDSTNSKLWARIGGVWKSVTLA